MDWVQRAGILAELVSFALIAPEIMGARRLRLVERALHRSCGRVLRANRIWSSERYVPLLPGTVSGDPDIEFVENLASWIIAAGFYAVWLPLLATGSLSAPVMAAMALVTVTLAMGILAVAAARWRPSNALSRWVSRTLAVPAMPAAWAAAAIHIAVILALRGLARLALGLLGRPGGLRAMVFGTGVVLLAAGMLAQFVSTF